MIGLIKTLIKSMLMSLQNLKKFTWDPSRTDSDVLYWEREVTRPDTSVNDLFIIETAKRGDLYGTTFLLDCTQGPGEIQTVNVLAGLYKEAETAAMGHTMWVEFAKRFNDNRKQNIEVLLCYPKVGDKL